MVAIESFKIAARSNFTINIAIYYSILAILRIQICDFLTLINYRLYIFLHSLNKLKFQFIPQKTNVYVLFN